MQFELGKMNSCLPDAISKSEYLKPIDYRKQKFDLVCAKCKSHYSYAAWTVLEEYDDCIRPSLLHDHRRDRYVVPSASTKSSKRINSAEPQPPPKRSKTTQQDNDLPPPQQDSAMPTWFRSEDWNAPHPGAKCKDKWCKNANYKECYTRKEPPYVREI